MRQEVFLLKFIHREGPQLAAYIQIKDLYHEFCNHYTGDMPDIVRLSFKFKDEFVLIEDRYLRYTNMKIVDFFMEARYIPDYDQVVSMSQESYDCWKEHYTTRIIELSERGDSDAICEINDLKYLLIEADTIRNHPDRLEFPSHEMYPMFVMA